MSWWGADSSTPQLAAGTGVSTGAHIKSPINIITDHVFTVLKPFLISTTMQYVAGQGSDQSLLVMRSYGDCEIPENDEVPTIIGYDTTAMVDDNGIEIDGGPATGDLVRSMATSPGNNVNFGRIIKEGALPYTSDVRAGDGTKITPYGVDSYTDPKTGKTYPAKGKPDSKVKKPKITIHVGAGLTFDAGSASDPLTGQAVIVHADLTKGLEFVADPNDTTSTAVAVKVDHKTTFFDSTGAITTDGSGGDSGAGGSGATPFPGKAIEILPTYGPAEAPIVAVAAGAGIAAGTYSYASAYTVGDAVSELGPASTVIASADNGQVSVGVHAVPLPAPDQRNTSTATGQNLYRSDDGGKTWKLVMGWGDTDAHYIADTAAPTTVYVKSIDTINVELAVVGGVNVSALQTNAGDDKNGLTIKLACCDSPTDTQDGSWDSGDAPDWGSFDFGSGWDDSGASGDPSDLGQAYWFNQGVFDAQNGNPRRTVTGNDLDNQAYQDGYDSTIALLGNGAVQGGRGFPIPELANPWDRAMTTSGSSGSSGGGSSGGVDIQGGATTCTKPCSGLTLSGGSNHGLAINLACGANVPCDTSSSSGGASGTGTSGGGAGEQGGAGQSFLALANPWARAMATSGSGGGTCDNISGLRIDGGDDTNGLMIMLKPISGMCIDKSGLGNQVDDITIKIDPTTNKMYAVAGGGAPDNDSDCATCLSLPPPTIITTPAPPGSTPGTVCSDPVTASDGTLTQECLTTTPVGAPPSNDPPTGTTNGGGPPGTVAQPPTSGQPTQPGYACDGTTPAQVAFTMHGDDPDIIIRSDGYDRWIAAFNNNIHITPSAPWVWIQGHFDGTRLLNGGAVRFCIQDDRGANFGMDYTQGGGWTLEADDIHTGLRTITQNPGDPCYFAVFAESCTNRVRCFLGNEPNTFYEVAVQSMQGFSFSTAFIDLTGNEGSWPPFPEPGIFPPAVLMDKVDSMTLWTGIPDNVKILNFDEGGTTVQGRNYIPPPSSGTALTGTSTTTTQPPITANGNLNVLGNLSSVGQFLNGLAVGGIITTTDINAAFAQYGDAFDEIVDPTTGIGYVSPVAMIPTGAPGMSGGLFWPGA